MSEIKDIFDRVYRERKMEKENQGKLAYVGLPSTSKESCCEGSNYDCAGEEEDQAHFERMEYVEAIKELKEDIEELRAENAGLQEQADDDDKIRQEYYDLRAFLADLLELDECEKTLSETVYALYGMYKGVKDIVR